MQDIVIVSAARTGVGKFGGGLSKLSATELGSLVVREVIARERSQFSQNIKIDFIFDSSEYAQSMVSELQGNILTAMALVLVLVVATLGVRSGLLVGFGIPFCLLGSMIVVNLLGFSFNFMVMFGLLLSLGMLIDGAIVVRKSHKSPRQGWAQAAAELVRQGDDALIMGEFGNADDGELTW